MKIHILTLTWNAIDKLTKLKDSLLPCLNELDWKWIIKSNGCQDNTYDTASEWHTNISMIKYPNNNQTFAEGVNYCFDYANPADEDYILLLNNDIIFNDTESIKNMISCIEKDSNIGAVGARLLYTGTNLLQHSGVIFMPQYKSPFHFRAGQVSDVNAEKNRYFQSITGALMLFKAGDFRKVNKMNCNYRWSFEDIDLCLSIKYNLNKKILYCGKTNVFHEESASLKKNPVNRLFMNHNLDYFRNKWLDRITLDQLQYEQDPNYNLAE